MDLRKLLMLCVLLVVLVGCASAPCPYTEKYRGNDTTYYSPGPKWVRGPNGALYMEKEISYSIERDYWQALDLEDGKADWEPNATRDLFWIKKNPLQDPKPY